jgi:hypothetical protein
MTKGRKLIVSDLDGTLLNSNGEMSANTIKIVKEVIEKGNIFCISTGRPERGAIHLYKKLGLNTIMSNYNGAYICNPTDPKFKPLSFTFVKDVVKIILNNDFIRKHIHNAVVENNEGA